jgi:hypothetical protein
MDKRIPFNEDIAREVGIPGAVVIECLHDLTSAGRASEVLNGSKYVNKSLDEWRRLYLPFWTRDIIRRTIERLVKQGVVKRHKPGDKNNSPVWYALNYDSALVQQYYGGAE